MKTIDLRSDTVTRPDDEMREIMAAAPVGDDVFGEDPTINKLQNTIAEITGKEAALFVASGTQANQIAVNAHTQPGDEVICEARCHIFNYEAGAAGALSGVQLHPLNGKYGILDPEDVEAAIRPNDHHYAQTRLISLENTNNRWGGTIYPLKDIKKTRSIARKHRLQMHLDGARLWNASVATDTPIKDYCTPFDSVSLCFSKGLGAPVGSILAGKKSFIQKAHYYRKMYGGGMRQAGILAAAALHAMKHNFNRLADDHRRAKTLAEAINQIPGLVVNLQTVETNIIIIDSSLCPRNSKEIVEALAKHGIQVLAFSPTRIRMVIHMHISDADIEYTAAVLNSMATG